MIDPGQLGARIGKAVHEVKGLQGKVHHVDVSVGDFVPRKGVAVVDTIKLNVWIVTFNDRP